jgi:cellulose synthase/poly-beta-1,6-N-acetylglucosamine synthase-like glycosyltransferase
VLDSLSRLSYEGQWEVLVVDNASTDGTGNFVMQWSQRLPSLRVVREPTPGLANARLCAIREARYENLCFIDDDNLPDADYLQIACEILQSHQDVGMIVARTELHELADPPEWFKEVGGCYAVGPQASTESYLSATAHCWGAGCVVRNSALRQLLDSGFRFLLSGRVGSKQLAGEDTEMALALNIIGWRTYYSDRLVVGHAIDPSRMSIQDLKKICTGFGCSATVLGVYEGVLEGGMRRWIKHHDLPAVALALRRYLKALVGKLLRSGLRSDVLVWQSAAALKGLRNPSLRPSAVRASPFLRRAELARSNARSSADRVQT